MPQHRLHNIVLLALLQVGGLVMAVLTAGLSYRTHSALPIPVPWLTRLVSDHGLWLLALPLVWVIVALRGWLLPHAGEARRQWILLAGVALLAGAALYAGHELRQSLGLLAHIPAATAAATYE